MSNPPPNQGYSNPNYQYYIGNNPNKWSQINRYDMF
jgi:hypothetical protein